jgi:hypothetical protein
MRTYEKWTSHENYCQIVTHEVCDVIIPSHKCHTLQSLNLACFKHFKMAFKAYKNVWTLFNKGKGVRKENLARGWGWI